jgi:hypothetical protein
MPVIHPSGGSSRGRFLVALASLAAGATLALGYRERLLVPFAVSSPAHACDAYTCYWYSDVISPISWPAGLRFCCFNSQCFPITGKPFQVFGMDSTISMKTPSFFRLLVRVVVDWGASELLPHCGAHIPPCSGRPRDPSHAGCSFLPALPANLPTSATLA